MWEEEKGVLLEGLTGRSRDITGVLLENQRQHMHEAFPGSFTSLTGGNVAKFDKVIFPVIRRVSVGLLGMELVGVQPMNASVGIVRALRVRYGNQVAQNAPFPIDATSPAQNEEAGWNQIYEKYSFLKNGEPNYDVVDTFTLPFQFTLHLEHDGGQEMNVEILKKTVEAKTRKLQAKWTLEAQDDSMDLHGIDLEQELTAALSDEIIRELDREIIFRLEAAAGAATTINMAVADGRYASEKFTALSIAISALSSEIAVATKRCGATWAVVSPAVAVALRHANNGAFVPSTTPCGYTGSAFIGTLNGSIKVYVDVYATTNKILLGYKGASEWETGLVYSPYLPLMSSGKVTDPTTFDPVMGLRTRYALTSFDSTTDSLGNSGDFYRRTTVTNLILGV